VIFTATLALGPHFALIDKTNAQKSVPSNFLTDDVATGRSHREALRAQS
jgi:hypothetical protein